MRHNTLNRTRLIRHTPAVNIPLRSIVNRYFPTFHPLPYYCCPIKLEKETGRDISAIDTGKISDLCTYLYCCIAAASNKEGKEFNMSFEDFADRLTPEDMAEWNKAISEDYAVEADDADDGKKTGNRT